jgi:hypothetical protein
MALTERLLRLGAALSSLALAFLALSWSGVWLEAAAQTRMGGVALFALATLLLIAREVKRGAPSRREALARLDAADGSGARPAASLDDQLADGEASETTRAIWSLHRRQLERRLAATPIAPPRPGLPQRDPYALRLAALLAAIAAGFVAGDDKAGRLAAAFDWRGAAFSLQAARFDAWLDPPPYTGREQIMLSGAPETLAAPINSVLHMRPATLARVEGALAPLAPAKGAEDEKTFRLTGAARALAPDRAYALTAIPDTPPTIELAAPPRLNLRGTMTLAYVLDDDYGVVAAEAQISRPGAGRTLYPPPQLPLEPPKGNKGRGRAETLLDLSDSPWAGAAATLVLVAHDEAGNEGRSEPREIMLPQRHFTKPLARLLAMERRALALAPDDAEKVRQALQDLTQTDDFLAAPSSIFLGMRLALRGIEKPHGDDDLRQVADLLWAMALGLEDGDLAQAERELRAAERKLSEALAQGASDEEVAKLSQELRDAMDKFMRNALDRAARERGAQQQQPPSESETQEITKDDLDQLLEALDQAIKSGDTALAQKLLEELSGIMENLQTSRGGQGGARARRQLSDLDELAREQQQLRDETYQGMTRGEPGGRPQAGRGGGKAAQKQRELRERLERELNELRQSAEGAPSELDDADRAMDRAEQSLDQGPSGAPQAVESQGRALQALRRGADALAKRGEKQQGGDGSGGGRPQMRDPLGRLNGQDNPNARYDPLGLPPAQRARRLQEELRRRLGQPERPAPELDYLQRLLPR